jgi:peptidyl-prolyl cis-trans isomerase B (cyclophilin B)
MTNTLAVLSLVFSFIVAIVGVILGHVALSQIARTGQEGRGLAITGLVVGYVSLLAGMIFSVRAIYLFSQLF